MGIKISELPFLTPPSPSDFIPIARGDTTGRISASELNNTVVVANIPNISTLIPVISTNIGNGDRFLIRAGGLNTGEVEIFTGNNGNEPIHVRQYSGSTTIARTFTLLDSSGYTSIPSRLGVGTTSIPRTLTIQGDASFTGNTTVPLVDITQSGTGLGLRANKIGLNTTNTAYELTVVGSVSATGNIFSGSNATDNRHLTNKQYVDNEITKLNLTKFAILSAENQAFTGTTSFSSIFITASAANSNYTVTHMPVFLSDPSTGIARQVFVRTASDIRTIINAEPAITTLPVNKGGTGVATHTSGEVLVGNGTSAVTTTSRNGIDTRTMFPTRKIVVADIGGTGAVAFSAVHNWNTRDVLVTVLEQNPPYRVVYPTIEHERLDLVRVIFATPPSISQYKIVVIG